MREAAAFAVRRCCSPLWKRGAGGIRFLLQQLHRPDGKANPPAHWISFGAHSGAGASPLLQRGRIPRGRINEGRSTQRSTSAGDINKRLPLLPPFGKGGQGDSLSPRQPHRPDRKANPPAHWIPFGGHSGAGASPLLQSGLIDEVGSTWRSASNGDVGKRQQPQARSDSRFPIPDSRFPNPQSPIPNPQSPIPNPESRIPNPESRIPNPESRIPNPESPLKAT